MSACVDLRQHEFEAAMHGGQMAGEYLDEIGKTDLASLTEKEWQQFCVLLVRNAYKKRCELDTQVPF